MNEWLIQSFLFFKVWICLGPCRLFTSVELCFPRDQRASSRHYLARSIDPYVSKASLCKESLSLSLMVPQSPWHTFAKAFDKPVPLSINQSVNSLSLIISINLRLIFSIRFHQLQLQVLMSQQQPRRRQLEETATLLLLLLLPQTLLLLLLQKRRKRRMKKPSTHAG